MNLKTFLSTDPVLSCGHSKDTHKVMQGAAVPWWHGTENWNKLSRLILPQSSKCSCAFIWQQWLNPHRECFARLNTWPKVIARTVYGILETPGRFPESTLDGMANFYSHHITSLKNKPPLPLLPRFLSTPVSFLHISRWYCSSHEHPESWCLYLLPVHRRHRLQTGWPWGWTCPFVLPFAACASLYAPCPCPQTSPPGLKRPPAAQETKGDTQGMNLMHTNSLIHTSNTDLVEWDPLPDVFHAAHQAMNFDPYNRVRESGSKGPWRVKASSLAPSWIQNSSF